MTLIYYCHTALFDVKILRYICTVHRLGLTGSAGLTLYESNISCWSTKNIVTCANIVPTLYLGLRHQCHLHLLVRNCTCIDGLNYNTVIRRSIIIDLLILVTKDNSIYNFNICIHNNYLSVLLFLFAVASLVKNA